MFTWIHCGVLFMFLILSCYTHCSCINAKMQTIQIVLNLTTEIHKAANSLLCAKFPIKEGYRYKWSLNNILALYLARGVNGGSFSDILSPFHHNGFNFNSNFNLVIVWGKIRLGEKITPDCCVDLWSGHKCLLVNERSWMVMSIVYIALFEL